MIPFTWDTVPKVGTFRETESRMGGAGAGGGGKGVGIGRDGASDGKMDKVLEMDAVMGIQH